MSELKTLLVFPATRCLEYVGGGPPLGICYLAAMLEKEGLPVKLLDCAIASEHEVVNGIKWADVVGISAPTVLASRALLLAKYAKERAKIVIVGGPHATLQPEFFLKSGYVDFVVRGEGEYTLLELLRAIDQLNGLMHTKGISYVKNGKVIHNPERPLIKNLDEIPFPARHLLPLQRYFRYQKLFMGGPSPRLRMITSRGCPFSCIFCAKEIFGRFYRSRSPCNVVDEMDLLFDRYGVKYIDFVDDIFTINKQRTLELCNEIIRRGLHEKISWSCETRVDLVDYQLLVNMRKAGCKEIFFGVESGSQRILNTLNKGFSVEQIRGAIKAAKRAGLIVNCFLIIGTPSETIQDIELTKNLIFTTKPDYIGVSIFTPLPGTRAFEMLKDKLYDEISLDNFSYSNNLIFRHENFSREYILRLKKSMLVEYKLKSMFSSPAKLIRNS